MHKAYLNNTNSTSPGYGSTSAKKAIGRLDKVIGLIEEAESRPACRFPSDIEPPTGSDVIAQSEADQHQAERQFHRQAHLRSAVRLFCAKALLSAREGDSAGVVSAIENGLKVRSALSNRLSIVDNLVNAAIITIIMANLRQAMLLRPLDEAQLRHLDSAFSRIDPARDYRNALLGERVLSLRDAQWERMARVWPFAYGDAVSYLDFMERQLEAANLSYSQARSKGLSQDKIENKLPFYALLTKIIAPTLVRVSEYRYVVDGDIACCRTALALGVYRSRFARYPKSLDKLRSQVKWDIPVDPFTGKDLIYKPSGDGYTLYSVGPNQVNDGGYGKYTPGEVLMRLHIPDADDIVWKMDH